MKTTTTIRRSSFARFVVATRLHKLVPAAFLLVLLGSALPLAAQSSATGGIVIADFNHDGIPDTLVPSGKSTFTLSFGTVPYGAFSTTAKIVTAPAGCSSVLPNQVVAGDFNNDGIPDLAMICAGSSTTLYVMLGAGDGTFTPVYSQTSLSNIVAGHFNSLTNLDLVTFGSTTVNGVQFQGIIEYANSGNATFTTTTTNVGSTVYTSAVATDLDGDGFTDLALGNFSGRNSPTVDVYGNNKNGYFGTQLDTFSAPSKSINLGDPEFVSGRAVLTGNFYTATVNDLAVVDTGSSPGVFIIQNNSTSGSFSLASPLKVASPGITSAVVASITGTLSDLLVSNGSTLRVLANSNDGLGTFSANTFDGLTLSSESSLYAAVDANADGHADIYTATNISNGTQLAVNLVSGSASASSTPFSLPAGTTPVAAVWPGNINFTGFTANGSQISNALAATVSIVSSKNPSLVNDSVTFSASVVPVNPGNSIPSGTLTFVRDGEFQLGTVELGPNLSGSVTLSTIPAGSHNISVTYSGDNIFASASKSLTQVVNAASTVDWFPGATTITYGTPLGAAQLDATAFDSNDNPLAGTFVYTPGAGTILGVGERDIALTFTPTNPNYTPTTLHKTINVTQATPTISWTTPASIAYGIALSATQLNATVTGYNGAILPGTTVYSPAIGASLSPGTHTLTVSFTPTDAVNYISTSATVNIVISNLTLTSFTPNTAQIGAGATTITITGSGFIAGTIARVNGSNIATTLVNPTTLTAVVPASNFTVAGTLQISLINPSTEATSSSLPLTVSTPTPVANLTAPSTAPAGTQPAINFGLTQTYPVPLVATFTLTTKSNVATGVVDPAVQFATGGSTYTTTIPAGTTTIPAIQVQAGTLAATITVPVTLTANGVNVTPQGLTATIVVPAAVPAITATTLTRSGQQLTVTVTGFSNTLDIVKADFHFTPIAGASLSTTDLSAPVGPVFATYFALPSTLTYGGTFVYTQVFNVSDAASNIASVQVKLTNSVGVSTTQTAQ